MSMEAGSSNAYLATPKLTWWSTQTTKEKKLIIIFAIASVLAFIFFICTIVLGTKTRYEPNCDGTGTENEPAGGSKVCSTKECRQTAFQMQIKMNEDADPCEFFYDFACGGFDAIHGEEENIPRIAEKEFEERFEGIKVNMTTGTMKNAANPAVSVYNSCIIQGIDNERGVNSLKEMIKEVLGTDWPMALGNNWDENKFNYNQSLAKLIKIGSPHSLSSVKTLHTLPFVSILVMPDTKNYTQYTALLFGPAAHLDVPENLKNVFCVLYQDCKSIPELDNEIKALKGFNQANTYSSENAGKGTQGKDIPLILRSVADVTVKYTVSRLTGLVPQIDWNTFFQTLFEGTGSNLPSNFEVTSQGIESNQKHFQGLTESKRLLANAIALTIVKKFGPLFSTDIERMMHPGQTRDVTCANFISNYLGFAYGKLYIDEYLPEPTLKEITEITLALKDGFRNLALHAPWIDNETQKMALEKLDNMVSVVVSPAWVFNDTAMREYYQAVTDDKDKSFLLSSRAAVDNVFNQGIKLLNSVLDRSNYWPAESAKVFNAFYFPNTNSMYYPLGLLKKPYFSSGRSRAIKFGSLGYFAGHEITHGFDSKGKDYDKNGMVNNWWDPETSKKFDEGAACFLEQYSNIKDEITGLQLNGAITLGENIADNGGLRAAFQAYKNAPEDSNGRLIGLETYSEDQLFFISAAQTWCAKYSKKEMEGEILQNDHPPHKYRAYVPFLNFPEFAKAFQCKEGTPMNPKNKCEIW